jgi:hypothetical protein
MPTKTNESYNFYDYPLGTDDLGLPKVRDMSKIETGVMNSAILCIIRLILIEKGTYPDHPDMGVGIRSRYRFAFESELTSLQEDIETQISTYLPEVSPVTVKVALENDRNDILKNKIKISIIIDETEYLLSYDVTSNTLEGIKFR